MAIEDSLAIYEARTTTKGYNKIRNRFLSWGKRGTSHFNQKDRKIIGGENQAAHGGDALYDYALFQSQAVTALPEVMPSHSASPPFAACPP